MAAMTLPITSRRTSSTKTEAQAVLPIVTRRRKVEVEDKPCLRFGDIYEVDYNVQLGAGACGGVYLANTCRPEEAAQRAQKPIPSKVAVKIIPVHNASVRQFALQEAHALWAVNCHGGICSILDCFEESRHVYIVLEYIVGHSLYEEISNFGLRDDKFAANIVHQLFDTLAYCHAAKREVVHGDVKPENIMLQFEGHDRPPTVKVIDFGSSCMGLKEAPDTCDRRYSDVFGTTDYSAPEARKTGVRTPATDMWSAGIVLYTMLVGSLPSDIVREGLSPGDPLPDVVSQRVTVGARDLIVRLLQAAPERRLTAAEASSHPWIAAAVLGPIPSKCSEHDDDTSTCASTPHASLESLENMMGSAEIGS
eukprot:TRINITY_DN28954_c0_g1_i1.p1 TRINITY_DN28954_c0_g1~~TRINITY_DN28954_c0_g1_i1.p1  ORF type:complete len:383 (-),score=66.42 TRINITY_DN28954_c0_g1_i1:960-2054(-)